MFTLFIAQHYLFACFTQLPFSHLPMISVKQNSALFLLAKFRVQDDAAAVAVDCAIGDAVMRFGDDVKTFSFGLPCSS